MNHGSCIRNGATTTSWGQGYASPPRAQAPVYTPMSTCIFIHVSISIHVFVRMSARGTTCASIHMSDAQAPAPSNCTPTKPGTVTTQPAQPREDQYHARRQVDLGWLEVGSFFYDEDFVAGDWRLLPWVGNEGRRVGFVLRALTITICAVTIGHN